MAELIASPYGITLPYSSIFNVNLRHQSKRSAQSRSSSYFWDRATEASPSHATPDAVPDNISLSLSTPDLNDFAAEPIQNQSKSSKKHRKPLRYKLRKIAFKAFTPKSDGTGQKNNVVRTTEFVSRHEKVQLNGSSENERFSIFRSWKLKSKAGGAQIQKMVAVVKHRISATSPPEQKPKTWEEFQYLYANEQIDVHNPPLPPTEPANEGETPTAFQSRFFPAPKPPNQPIRQLVLNRLGVWGKTGYDPTEEGAATNKARVELGNQLIEQGKVPLSLELPWEYRNSFTSDGPEATIEPRTPQNLDLPPESLEQHPVFRRIVQRCRELFQVSVGILSILDDERQIFLAESGLESVPALNGLREVTRDITFCAHTVLSGRKGFTVLDTHQDWRFQNGPLVQGFGLRFYAGVPLMAPNMDGSQEAEENSCPIGTLCVLDWEPRESFTPEDRKKLIYLSEYARREIEKWFAKKIEHKKATLAASEESWKQELTRIESPSNDGLPLLESEVLCNVPQNDDGTKTRRGRFGKLRSVSSASEASELTTPTSESPTGHHFQSRTKTRPRLFENVDLALKPNMRKVFDLATKLVAETLDLSLVYLAAVVPYDESTQLGNTMVISSHNLPMPAPFFDTALHLKALKTPEGGLLYQNPSIEESEKDGLQPKSPTSDGNGKPNLAYASAILLAVSTEAQSNGGGFVLAGYTDDTKRVFGEEDVSYMKQFANELHRYTSKLRL